MSNSRDGKLLLGERMVVVPHRGFDRRVVGVEGLHQHAAALRPATGPARDLHQQLKRPLGGAKVGQVQGRVGVDHADQRDVGKIEPLGDHLRAQQDADLALAKSGQRPLVAPGRLHGVGVHPQAAMSGKRARTSASSRCVPRPL